MSRWSRTPASANLDSKEGVKCNAQCPDPGRYVHYYHPERRGAPTTTPAFTMESSQPPRRTVALEPRTEFRFETDDGASVSITLVAGAAEVFGAEMVMNRSYSFTDAQQVALPRPFWLSP